MKINAEHLHTKEEDRKKFATNIIHHTMPDHKIHKHKPELIRYHFPADIGSPRLFTSHVFMPTRFTLECKGIKEPMHKVKSIPQFVFAWTREDLFYLFRRWNNSADKKSCLGTNITYNRNLVCWVNPASSKSPSNHCLKIGKRWDVWIVFVKKKKRAMIAVKKTRSLENMDGACSCCKSLVCARSVNIMHI